MNRFPGALDRLDRTVLAGVEENAIASIKTHGILGVVSDQDNRSIYGGFAIRFEDDDLKYMLTTTPIPN